jgi:hypothetical protein
MVALPPTASQEEHRTTTEHGKHTAFGHRAPKQDSKWESPPSRHTFGRRYAPHQAHRGAKERAKEMAGAPQPSHKAEVADGHAGVYPKNTNKTKKTERGGVFARAHVNAWHAAEQHPHMCKQTGEDGGGCHLPNPRESRCSLQTSRTLTLPNPKPRCDVSKSTPTALFHSDPHAFGTATAGKRERAATSTLCEEGVGRGSAPTSLANQASETEANSGRRCRPDHEPVKGDEKPMDRFCPREGVLIHGQDKRCLQATVGLPRFFERGSVICHSTWTRNPLTHL